MIIKHTIIITIIGVIVILLFGYGNRTKALTKEYLLGITSFFFFFFFFPLRCIGLLQVLTPSPQKHLKQLKVDRILLLSTFVYEYYLRVCFWTENMDYLGNFRTFCIVR